MVHDYDKVFDALADVRRRELLLAVLDESRRGESTTGLDVGTATAVSDETSELELHHTHLPKLTDYGFVEWDSGGSRVTTGPEFDRIAPLLELLVARDDDLPLDGLTRYH